MLIHTCGLFHYHMLKSPFVILGVSGIFYRFCSILMENHVSKEYRHWSVTTLCGVWSGSALFAYDPFTGFQVTIG